MSLSTVTTMGYEVGTLSLVVTLGYGQGAAPPPPPPVSVSQVYGPALTEYERNRWFGDYDPDREKRKKALERAKRIELGIIKELKIPTKIKAEVREVVKEAAQVEVFRSQYVEEASVISRLVAEISADLKLALREDKELREVRRQKELRRLESEEEEEAIEVATLFMLN